MPNVPERIDRSQFMAALADLGIDTSHLFRLAADVDGVRLTYLALNAEGKKYLTDGVPTEVTYQVPIVVNDPAGTGSR